MLFGGTFKKHKKNKDSISLKKTREMKIDVKGVFMDKICCIAGDCIVGREDGILQIHDKETKKEHMAEIFQKEVDLLDNDLIKEKITAIEMVHQKSIGYHAFVSNEKNIKLVEVRPNIPVQKKLNNALPKQTFKIFQSQENGTFTREPTRVIEKIKLNNVHRYSINDLSTNLGQDYLISSDLLRINLWSTERMNQYFTLVDFKSMIDEGRIFVINSTKFSPNNDSLFGFSTSQGLVSLHDTKISPRSSNIVNLKKSDEISPNKNTNRNINMNTVNIIRPPKSVSDFCFIDDYKVATRSLDSVEVFDIRKPSKRLFDTPIVQMTDELTNSDLIYEKFKITSIGSNLYTGTPHGEICTINTLTERMEKIKVKESTRIQKEDSIRLISHKNNTISCVGDTTVYQYQVT